MAITNHERIGKALELLKGGLAPFVEREFKNVYKEKALAEAQRFITSERLDAKKPFASWDAAVQLRLMWAAWNDVFRHTLGKAERSLVQELTDVRNKWAHQEPFSGDDAYRAIDSVARLLTAVSAPQSDEIEKMRGELLRVRFEEQARTEKRKTAGTAIESQATGTLKPWREVVTPHDDVASGRYQQAEFAADLWQVHLGEGTDEYRKPAEFFRRTFLTGSLTQLLVGAIHRLSGTGGDPVVQLQTNFGGGKTHSMLALYHLFSGTPTSDLVGMDAVFKEAGATKVPRVNRVVLVGNKISPGNPITKADGTVVRTLWGELAWQLGLAAGGPKEAKKAFKRIQADDEKATSPGDRLRELFNDYGPCLVLIDEWVAYARQLHDGDDLPGGSFETHFTFAQALTESAKLVKNCLLVISLPASDTSGSPHARADDVEVGGERGRAALDRLRNAVGRVEATWRPATAEEGFEIVRRRLFKPIQDRAHYVARDLVAQAFHDLYDGQRAEFPPECRNSDYEKRIKDAYPIHPEVFDRLYTDWSTLVKFQRTRGVLRLMAAVIHSLWEKGDRNPLIMPSNIPIDDQRVQFELTRYLTDNWTGVLDKDVDGPNALPLRIDSDVPNLGKFAACRRVARTLYLGSAPTATAANRGIEDRQIKLGCVMPGESPAIFGDALRRLSGAATYLYQDGPRYWYSTQATRLSGSDPLAVRASKRLGKDDGLCTAMAGTILRMAVDKIPLWRGDHVPIKQLVEDFAKYVYLPRLTEPAVLVDAVGDGLPLMTWDRESFAYADRFDESTGRYVGLRGGQHVSTIDTNGGLLVHPAAARRQLDAEAVPPPSVDAPSPGAAPLRSGKTVIPPPTGATAKPTERPKPTRFHASVTLDANRVGRDASRIAEEVLAHLTGLVRARAEVTLEIQVDIPDGAPANVVRTVTENCRTLRFDAAEFEE